MCLVADRVYLASADEATGSQSLMCLDRNTGTMIWSTTVHEKGGMRKNEKSTAASSTPACDGQRIYINFPNEGRLMASAVDLDGKLIWQTKVSDYIEHQGYGASPALYQSIVIIAADTKAGGAIAGLDRSSGQIVWRRERPKLPNYPSPVLVHLFGKDQLIMTGCDLITSLNPLSGELFWEVAGATTECVTSTPSDGKHIYTSGGYPRNHISAVLADGSGKIVWENECSCLCSLPFDSPRNPLQRARCGYRRCLGRLERQRTLAKPTRGHLLRLARSRRLQDLRLERSR